MKENSTPLTTSAMKPTSAFTHNGQRAPRPRRSTILMLRQFARAYTCPATLPVTLGAFVAN